MEGNGLFNPGFLGANFLWWVGQIADDSTWRDNISSGKFTSGESIAGWGRRYKVRIVGLHDKEEEAVKSDQLPWAQVMYPVTAGGGNANSGQTPNLRQGMFVFGFFMDGPDQQVPVIMGVLGHNEQTPLKTKIGENDSNFAATSGFAEGKQPKSQATKETVPDEGKVTEKPRSAELAKESAPLPKKAKRNKYGVKEGTNLSAAQQADANAERAKINEEIARGGALALTPEPERSATIKILIQDAIATGTANRKREADAPTSPNVPGATREGTANVHQQSSADLVRDDKLEEKIPLSKPETKVQSAVKNIQTVIETLTTKLDKYLNAITSYADAVSSRVPSLDGIIDKATREIQKYMKVIFDKVLDYTMKTLNEGLTRVVSALPISMRANFSDMKEEMTKNLIGEFEGITNGLGGLIKGLLNKALQPDKLEAAAREAAGNASPDPYDKNAGISTDGGPPKPVKNKKIKVPICYAEDLVGDALAASADPINDINNKALEGVNLYVKDMKNQIASLSGTLGSSSTSPSQGKSPKDDIGDTILTQLTGGLSEIGNITGSLTSALNFMNVTTKMFDFELPANQAVSDYYTLATGGAGTPDSALPTAKGIADSAANAITDRTPNGVSLPPEPPFAQPTKDLNKQPTQERDAIASDADLDRELAAAKAGDRSGLDGALEF